ncbi:MAG: alpha-galactosidase [Opitutales bacterium]|nr:alpha-galactosidase [Opitutales bacterium]
MKLSSAHPVADFAMGDFVARYRLDAATRRVTFHLLPSTCLDATVEARASVDTPVAHTGQSRKWPAVMARKADSLVQVKLRGDGAGHGFGLGRTLRNGPSVEALIFDRQEVVRSDGGEMRIDTHLAGPGFAVTHRLTWAPGDLAIVVTTVLRNTGDKPVTVEMLSSFCLNDLTPFARDDAPGRLHAHRFRSTWSSEGRHENQLLEDLHLERSWAGHSHQSERFGQVGTMPVRGWFPFVALEDRGAGVFWGAQLAWAGSWQMEIYRRHDDVNLSGGLADREFGHWWKTLGPGESLDSPAAHLAVAAGDLDDLCHRLVSLQAKPLAAQPAIEHDLPILFNEWCSSWGNPSHDYVVETARRLVGSEVRIIVIDDGWAERPGNQFQQNGDWIVNRRAFPDGLGATTAALREAGFLTGLWFEMEVCNPGSRAYGERTALQLAADGVPLAVGPRRFWDLRHPGAVAYLDEKVLARLRDDGFAYLKVDYNDTIGVGCDGAESPGEGLRQQVLATQAYFRRLREALPDLIIENCSSGGHRLEPSMMALCAMGSFSDAHETLEIPVLAANLHRLILPRQNQVWAVLNPGDSLQRLTYSLAATFLGRMCLSGDLKDLSSDAWDLACAAQRLYRRCVPALRDGRSRLLRDLGPSFRYPTGSQEVVRTAADGKSIVIVAHTFAQPDGPTTRTVPLRAGAGWRLTGRFGTRAATLADDRLELAPAPDLTGAVYFLER